MTTLDITKYITEPKLQGKAGTRVHLPHTGLSYEATQRYNPILLDSIPLEDLTTFRVTFMEKMNREGKQIALTSYPRRGPSQNVVNFHAVVDYARVRRKETHTDVPLDYYIYTTQSHDPFLKRVLPIAEELLLLKETYNPGNPDALEELHTTIDAYLQKSKIPTSFREFLETDTRKIRGVYTDRAGSEKRSGFRDISILHLGSLAFLNREQKGQTISPEDYFKKWRALKIHPIKNEHEAELTAFIEQTLQE